MELEPTIDTELAPAEAATAAGTEPADEALVDDELLVEEISIDGMCGVY